MSKNQISTETSKKISFDFPVDLKQLSQDFEVDLINQALIDNQFNQKKTAEKLGLTYHQLRGYLKKYNLLEQTNEDME
jgi:psp operon transcriptional activator